MFQESIRNFAILSHVDHGKSTLADRFLELTKTVPKEKMRPQFLDSMDLERERGVTIKMQPVRMHWKDFTLNLIDTPGHIDFSYEVSRSLAAVEGVILLVDGSRGIQAQTVANLELAKKENLVILPAINKIDLPQADIEKTKREILDLLGEKEIFLVSAKYGTNVEQILEAVIKKIPSPKGNSENPFKALIFDSKYDPFKGVIIYIRVFEGRVKKGDKIYFLKNQFETSIKEVGCFFPQLREKEKLEAGEIGYIATGIKEIEKVKVGETITNINFKEKVLPLGGYKEPKPMVFASVFPDHSENFNLLKEGLAKLKLNDASLSFQSQNSPVGRGFLCGFLGTFHEEITLERLKREYNLNLLISLPQVVYKVILKDGKEKLVFTSKDWPETIKIQKSLEPYVKLEIITPEKFLGNVSTLLKTIKAKHIKTSFFGRETFLIIYEVPLREIIFDFHDKLKSATQGFASLDYQMTDWREEDLIKLEIFIGGEKEESLSRIVPKDKAFLEGKRFLKKLKEVFPAQLFALPLQAKISDKVIARETIKAKRRDVIAPLYGGDYTRKRKLLERQKKGKKKLKERGQIRIPQDVFLKLLKSD